MTPRIASPNAVCCDDRCWTDDYSYDSTIDVATYDMSKLKLSGGGGTSSSVPPNRVVQVQQQQQPKRPILSKILRFAAEDEILLIRHIDDFSDDEVAAIWFDQQYYADIKSEYKSIIVTMERGQHMEGDDVTCRGLEHRTQEGSWARFQIKRDSYNAVLDEQDRQWKVDCDDDEKISCIYKNHSHKCARKAHQMGLMDEIAARKVYAETSNPVGTRQLRPLSKNSFASNSNSNHSNNNTNTPRGILSTSSHHR